jgi:fructose-1,6-bisphosphatase/inositol monophosphatase family enzyme
LITAELPGHLVVGEEYGGTAGDGPTWYCDPVDGTTNLTAGLPWTSFSLAMAVGDAPLVGVVADPWRQEIWQAAAGRGVLINGAPQRSRTDDHPAALAGGVVGTEWASYVPWPGMDGFLAELAARHCTTRVMGSSTLTIAQVAVGRTVGAVIGEFHPEDHLAATLLCQEAGLAVRDESGAQQPFPSAGGIMVARPEVADELFDIWAAARTGARNAAG